MWTLARTAGFLCLLTATAVGAESKNAHFERALKHWEELRLTEASKSLEAARAVRENSREVLLQILEMQGVVAASLKQMDRAELYFRTLRSLAPDYKMKGDYSPKVMTPYFEAGAWVDEQGALRFNASERALARSVRLKACAVSDLLALSASVRFHVQAAEAWQEKQVVLEPKRRCAQLEVEAPSFRWWAELLGEHDEVLATLASEQEPKTSEAQGEAAEPPVAAAPPEAVDPRPELSEPVSSAPAFSKWIPVGTWGAGAATGAVGVFFGLRAAEARSTLEQLKPDSSGRVVELTQLEADRLNKRAKADATVANVLFGAASVLAVTGGVLWWLSDGVAVTPLPGGVAVSGVLP